ncbi:MAG: hypothetical protein WAO55_06575, partial [Candidatus Manganitrophaceae bacterium]
YEVAKARLIQIENSLQRENPSAAASLAEGMEETLTLHRLGVSFTLASSFSTTNVLESINAQLGRLTRNVTRCRTGDQKQRWVASALIGYRTASEAGQRLSGLAAVACSHPAGTGR